MTLGKLLFLPGLVLVANCAPSNTPPPATAALPANIGGVVGQNAVGLSSLFGQPTADLREGTARKLQFSGPICVLDAYLYPKGSAEPRVTWVDTRQLDGKPIDRASCVAALTRRKGQ
jgi:hypothetical protein